MFSLKPCMIAIVCGPDVSYVIVIQCFNVEINIRNSLSNNVAILSFKRMFDMSMFCLGILNKKLAVLRFNKNSYSSNSEQLSNSSNIHRYYQQQQQQQMSNNSSSSEYSQVRERISLYSSVLNQADRKPAETHRFSLCQLTVLCISALSCKSVSSLGRR